ncbi:hypothetical protein [Defluviimonas aestuarii]|uniref:hypothetical protein n=1 Tax=Albidovulum aestuarii TaxID=1130726 RepID=UPI00249A10C2|nr:hypothetical protein [Defluviimonas aestuarii]
MSGKTFAQINCGLLKSQKMRGLSHAEKWAYLCVHLTPFASFSGVFHYPNVMWAHDACLTPDEFETARTRLAEVGLIEFDDAEEMVRIVGFHRQRPPENASRCISLVGDFQDALGNTNGDASMFLRAVAEFSVAALQRAQGWKPDSPERGKLRDVLGPFLKSTFQDMGDDFLEALTDEIAATSKAVRAEMASILPVLSTSSKDTVSAPCRDRVGTRDVDETRLRQDGYEDKDEEKDETARFFGTLDDDAWSRAEPSKLQRKEANGTGAPKVGPLPSTLRSRLATESLGTNTNGKGN